MEQCRDCGEPLIWRKGKPKPFSGRKYYYSKFQVCTGCQKLFFNKEFIVNYKKKVPKPDKPPRLKKQSTEKNRIFRKKVMAYYRTLNPGKARIFEGIIDDIIRKDRLRREFNGNFATKGD